MLYLLILSTAALLQIGVLSVISLLLYWLASRRRPSKRQALLCAAAMVLLTMAMLACAFATNTLDTTMPQWFFLAYCATLVTGGVFAAKLGESKSLD